MQLSQNLNSLTLTDAQLTAADAALTALEGAFTGLVALDGDELWGQRTLFLEANTN